jgi:hypothetical protein
MTVRLLMFMLLRLLLLQVHRFHIEGGLALLYGRSMASCPEDAIGAALCTLDAGITGQRCCAFVTYRCAASRAAPCQCQVSVCTMRGGGGALNKACWLLKQCMHSADQIYACTARDNPLPKLSQSGCLCLIL